MSTNDHTADEIVEARAPIASLLSKSEKALSKVAPDSWQHKRLEENIHALRVATRLIGIAGGVSDEPSRDEVERALFALDSMIERVVNTQTKFSPGTSQYSLQRNRLKSLRTARSALTSELDALGRD